MKPYETPTSRRGALMRAAFALGCLCSTSHAVEVAGSLLIDLDPADYNQAEGIWPQRSLTGIQGSFNKLANGTPKLETIAGAQAIVLDGDGDYLTGPNTTSALHGPNATHSVEYWAFQGQIRPEESVISWSRREGPDGTFAGFRYGSHNAWGAAARWGPPDMGYEGVHLNGPAAGAWHHIVVTFDGTTQKIYVDGQLNASEAATLDAKDGHPIYIGGERLNNGDDAGRFFQYSGAIGKLRVHSGALTDAQVLANYNEELAGYPGVTAAALPQPPLHRFSFNQAAGPAADGTVVTDSIGGLTGVVRGTGAQFTGTGIQLPGGAADTSPAYVDLPNGLISSKQRVSIEVWSTQLSNQNWSRLMAFGTSTIGEVNTPGNATGFNGADGLIVYANTEGNPHYRIERLGGGVLHGNTYRQSEDASVHNTELHHVVTYDPAASEWRLYRNGFLMEVLPESQGPTSLEDVNNWLGRSNFANDAGFNGIFNEFRVYNYTLNESQIRGNTLAGPEVVNLASPSDNFAWTPTAGGTYAFDNAGGQDNWGTGAGGAFPDGTGAFANITGTLTGPQTVELNTTATVGALTFGDLGGTHKITLAAGAAGVLEMDAGAYAPSINQSSTSAGNEISAPLSLTADTEIANLASNAPLTISGTVSGAGRFVKGGHGTVTITGDNSARSAGTAVNTGILDIGGGGFTGNLGSGPITTTDEGTLLFNLNANASFTQTITGPGAFTHGGAGTLTNNGNINNTGRVLVDDGSSFVNAANITGASSFLNDGSVVLEDGSVANPNGYASVGTINGGTMTIREGATFTVSGGGDFNIGDIGAGPSSLFVEGGEISVGTVWLGRNVGTSGVLLQTGGNIVERPGGGDNRIGGATPEANGSYGGWMMTGGTLQMANNLQIGGYGSGLMTIDGGNVNITGGFVAVGRFGGEGFASRGVLDVRSGSFTFDAGGNRIIAGEGGAGTINVRGDGTLVSAGGVTLGQTSGNGILNLHTGGLVETQLVNQLDPASATGTLNFHGGTLRARGDNANFIADIDRVYIHAAGAVIDSAGHDVATFQPFDDPTGQGIVTIPVINGGSGYLAPPVIEITGGGGTGATAVATLNGGTVTGITITNPGVDYTEAPVVNIHGDGFGTGLTLGTPTLTPNSPGFLTKTGEGSLTLNGTAFYTSSTIVQQGTLVINGDHAMVPGTVTVQSGATLGGVGTIGGRVVVNGSLNPGETTGTLLVENDVDFNAGSKLVIDIDGETGADKLDIDGDLDLTGAALELNVTGAADGLPYTIATFTGTRTGTFASVPAGTEVQYNAGSIVLTAVPAASGFQSWIAAFFPGETDPAIVGPDADPDGDGQPNSLEFALGGTPDNGADNAKIHHFTVDSDSDDQDELVMTIAVLEGTPGFTGTPSPTATHEGQVYTIQGSGDLADFQGGVSVVAEAVVPADAPTPPDGYEYRSFRLDASNGLSGRGFLRVDVTAAP